MRRAEIVTGSSIEPCQERPRRRRRRRRQRAQVRSWPGARRPYGAVGDATRLITTNDRLP